MKGALKILCRRGALHPVNRGEDLWDAYDRMGLSFEQHGRAGDRRAGAGRAVAPAGGAIGSGQLAEDLVGVVAGQGEGKGQRPVRQPGDMGTAGAVSGKPRPSGPVISRPCAT
jgi:hypothetical protein